MNSIVGSCCTINNNTYTFAITFYIVSKAKEAPVRYRLRDFWKVREIRRKIMFTFGLLAIYRLFAQLPVPGINREAAGLALSMSNEVSEGIGGTFLILDVFTGGGFSTFSVLTVGIYGYLVARVVAYIIFSIAPRFKRELVLFPLSGRERMNQWAHFLSVLVTILISSGLLNLYRGGFALCMAGYLDLSPVQIGLNSTLDTAAAIMAITAGAKFTEWLADRISEYGVRGGGVWIIVVVNILSAIPKGVARLWSDPQWRWVDLGVFAVVTIVAVFAIVCVLQARRNIPVNFPGRRVGARMESSKETLPLMIKLGGAQPLLLAQGLILLPVIASFPFLCSANQGVRGFASSVVEFYDLNNPWLWLVYFVVTAAFTFFSNDAFRSAQNFGERLQRNGARIPGIQPGRDTELYITRVVRQISLPAAVALGLLTVLPFVVNWLAGSSVFLVITVGLITVVIAIRDSLYTLKADALRMGYDYFIK
jgi:preprotein translocase subunit SecY